MSLCPCPFCKARRDEAAADAVWFEENRNDLDEARLRESLDKLDAAKRRRKTRGGHVPLGYPARYGYLVPRAEPPEP